MKKLSVVLVLLLLSVSLFANGARENAPDSHVPGSGRTNSDYVTISGTLNVTDAEVVLLSDDGEFSLSAPRAGLLDLESFNALSATVSGSLSECVDCENLYDGHIFVESAEVGGEEYDFDTMGRQDGFMAGADSYQGNRSMNSDDARGARNAADRDDNRSNSGRQMPDGKRGVRDMQDNRMMQNNRGGASNRSGSGFGGRGSI
jgi:hypothetical protein